MSLTMRTIRIGGQVTGYQFIGPSTERGPQIAVLTTALYALRPRGIYNPSTLVERQAMAAMSLQLAALLESWDGERPAAEGAHEVLAGVRKYLLQQRKDVILDAKVDEDTAGLELIDGYAYFDYKWGTLLAGSEAIL